MTTGYAAFLIALMCVALTFAVIFGRMIHRDCFPAHPDYSEELDQ
jgi:hypothetical protein